MMPSVSALRNQFSLYDENALAPIVTLEELSSKIFSSSSEGAPVGHPDAAICIGAFDGFHQGHQNLVRYTREDAKRRGIKSYIVTFDPDPDCVVGPGPAPKLLLMDARKRTLASTGVDGVIVIPFTKRLAALDHEAFFKTVLCPLINIKVIHVGSNFKLGRGGASNVSVIRAWGARRGIDVYGHSLVCADGNAISATRIRGLLAQGKVEEAAELLGRYHGIRGTVMHGRGQGTGMGFPTANVELDATLALPADGVYEGIMLIDGVAYPAAVNVGLPPMFELSEGSAHLEANVIGYSGNLYGKEVKLAFTRFLRPSKKFKDQAELVATVLGNIEDIKRNLGESGVAL